MDIVLWIVWSRTAMYTVYSSMHFLYMSAVYDAQFDRVKGHVRNPPSNSMYSSPQVHVCKISPFCADAFMSYRENGQTDRRTDIQDNRIKCSREHLINNAVTRNSVPCLHTSTSRHVRLTMSRNHDYRFIFNNVIYFVD